MKETEKTVENRKHLNENKLPTEEELELRFATAYLRGMDSLIKFVLGYNGISIIIITCINLYNLYIGKIMIKEFFKVNYLDIISWCVLTGFPLALLFPFLCNFWYELKNFWYELKNFWDKLRKSKEKNS